MTSRAAKPRRISSRNRAGGIVWQRNLRAHAQGAATQDHYYWYDGLRQVTRHDRGDLVPAAAAPGYTGIDPATLQQRETFAFDETGNWLATGGIDPALAQTRSHNAANACDWTFLYHAEFIDPATGLYNYGYRFYHPGLGRWLSRDPIGERGGGNLYASVSNAPIGRIDNLGMYDCNGISKEECEAKKNEQLERPKAREMRDLLQQFGCTYTVECRPCCWKNDPKSSEQNKKFNMYYKSGSKRITVCYCNEASKSREEDAMAHEMVHALDDCLGKGRKGCKEWACSETRAYKYAQGLSRSETRRRALGSLLLNNACGPEGPERTKNANDALNAVFDQCYDTGL